MAFKEVSLFLDDDDFFQAARKAPDVFGRQRIDHAQVQDANAQPLQRRMVQVHVEQRLLQVGLALAGADQPDAGVARLRFGPIQAVGGSVGTHRGVAFDEEVALELDGAGRQEGGVLVLAEGFTVDVHVRDDDVGQVGVNIHHAAAVAQIGDQFQGHPAAAEARQSESVQAVEQKFLDGGGIEDGDAGGEQGVVALVRQRGAFAIMVVACQHERRAVGSGAAHIGVLEHVATAIDAGAFAVPDTVHPVDLRGRGTGARSGCPSPRWRPIPRSPPAGGRCDAR